MQKLIEEHGLTALASILVAFFTWVFTVGFKRKKADTDSVILTAVNNATDTLIKIHKETSGEYERRMIQQNEYYENKLKDIEGKFGLKERELLLQISNLELEKTKLETENKTLSQAYKNKCLEYDSLVMEYQKLKDDYNGGGKIRNLNG